MCLPGCEPPGVSLSFEHAFDYSRTQDVAPEVLLIKRGPPTQMSEARHSVVLYDTALAGVQEPAQAGTSDEGQAHGTGT